MKKKVESEIPDWHVANSGQSEFWTSERCYITELMNIDSVSDVSLALARVEPGVTTQLHALRDIVEIYVVRKGTGLMEISGDSYRLTVGDKAIVAANAAQRITNTGTEDLEFFCLCTPRFHPDCYENLEKDTNED